MKNQRTTWKWSMRQWKASASASVPSLWLINAPFIRPPLEPGYFLTCRVHTLTCLPQRDGRPYFKFYVMLTFLPTSTLSGCSALRGAFWNVLLRQVFFFMPLVVLSLVCSDYSCFGRHVCISFCLFSLCCCRYKEFIFLRKASWRRYPRVRSEYPLYSFFFRFFFVIINWCLYLSLPYLVVLVSVLWRAFVVCVPSHGDGSLRLVVGFNVEQHAVLTAYWPIFFRDRFLDSCASFRQYFSGPVIGWEPRMWYLPGVVTGLWDGMG